MSDLKPFLFNILTEVLAMAIRHGNLKGGVGVK